MDAPGLVSPHWLKKACHPRAGTSLESFRFDGVLELLPFLHVTLFFRAETLDRMTARDDRSSWEAAAINSHLFFPALLNRAYLVFCEYQENIPGVIALRCQRRRNQALGLEFGCSWEAEEEQGRATLRFPYFFGKVRVET